MALREQVPAGFRPACEFPISATAKSVFVAGRKLKLPVPDPHRIVAFGDTGCRVKGADIQNCRDSSQWPFLQVASAAAKEKPELMIHVGDYLYRETACPSGSYLLCGDTPTGDNWDAWNADFFTPAAKLLEAAPWAFSRGNHEDCSRSWRGWFYYLDPRPWVGFCQAFSGPYKIKLGKFELVMLDSSAVKELSSDETQIAKYQEELSSIHADGAWLVDHHPFWGFATPGGFPVMISVPLEEAWNRVRPSGYSLILSGHVHLFEFVETGPGFADQLVLGDGGTEMATPLRVPIGNETVRGAKILGGASERQFGYTLLTSSRSGWRFTLKNSTGDILLSCELSDGAKSCASSQ